jgi:hypothetical protein
MDIDINNVSPEQLQMLARMPIGPPPPGVVPNFVNPPTRAALQIWPTSIFMGIALIFFFNRLYIKACLMKKWSWDDRKLTLLSHTFPFASQSNMMSSNFATIHGESRVHLYRGRKLTV